MHIATSVLGSQQTSPLRPSVLESVLMSKKLVVALLIRPPVSNWEKWPSSMAPSWFQRKPDHLQLVMSFVRLAMLFLMAILWGGLLVTLFGPSLHKTLAVPLSELVQIKIGRRTGSAALGRAAQMAGERGLARASGGNLLGNTLGIVKKVGSTLGKGYGPVNPFNLGYDLGHDVIAPAIMSGTGVGSRIDPGLGGARISFHDGTPLWKFAARRQSGGSFAPLGY
jgi:hypothetical protein